MRPPVPNPASILRAREGPDPMTIQTVALSGIKPTGELHLGNYVGAIRPLAELASLPDREIYVFVADLHALNTRPDPHRLGEHTHALAAALIACGLDADLVHIYRQSRVPQIAQISVLLGSVCAKGLLNRAHAYKAAVTANRRLVVTSTTASTPDSSPTRC